MRFLDVKTKSKAAQGQGHIIRLSERRQSSALAFNQREGTKECCHLLHTLLIKRDQITEMEKLSISLHVVKGGTLTSEEAPQHTTAHYSMTMYTCSRTRSMVNLRSSFFASSCQ